MTCYNPIRACYSKTEYAKTGKKNVHIVLHENYDNNGKVIKDEKWKLNESTYPHGCYEYINLPCRTCVGCRSDNAKMWSMRAFHEMSLHKHNCFITLTYDNNSSVVKNDPLCIASLRYKHFQNFMKRLRKRFPDADVRFLVSGEYGLKDGRAHWHAILFNFDFPDKELVYQSKGFPHYKSQILQELWSTYIREFDMYEPIGFVDLCDVDYECCSYVSQYVLKKLPIPKKNHIVDYYKDDEGNVKELELVDVAPPVVHSSRRPAIGLEWYNKHGENAVEKGFVALSINGVSKKIRTPSYYYSKFEQHFPERYEVIKKCKEEKMKKHYKLFPLNLDKLKSWQESHLYRITKSIKKDLTKFYK